MSLDTNCISTGISQCKDVLQVYSVSEKILPAKTCSYSFYPVSYTPWVYSNTNRNAVLINTLKDTPMKLDSHCISEGYFSMYRRYARYLCLRKNSSGKDLFLFFLPSIIHTLGVLKHLLKSTFNQHSKRYTHVTLFTVYLLEC